MVKLNTPLLSLDAHGSVGDSITFQSNTKRKFARQKPRLPYSLTLPQQYQRWLYQDYAHWWTLQSEVTKRECAAAGSRFHLTGFQYWMKYHLANMSDYVGWWPLDYITGGTTPDRSPFGHTATVIGASLVDGQIDHALHYDGINDVCVVTHAPSLNVTTAFTLMFFMTPGELGRQQQLIQKAWVSSFDVALWNTNRFVTRWQIGGVLVELAPPAATWTAVIDTCYHWAIVYNGSTLECFIDADSKQSKPASGLVGTNTLDLTFGARTVLAGIPFKGELDNIIYLNRALTQFEIQRHSERRFRPS